jgi:hypothetical protein
LDYVAAAVGDYLTACASQLRARQIAPSIDAVGAALDTYNAELAAVRTEGLTHSLSAEAAERFYALGFALEQMRQDLKDLARCVTEWAEHRTRATGLPKEQALTRVGP